MVQTKSSLARPLIIAGAAVAAPARERPQRLQSVSRATFPRSTLPLFIAGIPLEFVLLLHPVDDVSQGCAALFTICISKLNSLEAPIGLLAGSLHRRLDPDTDKIFA
jgi:hypothetical protein